MRAFFVELEIDYLSKSHISSFVSRPVYNFKTIKQCKKNDYFSQREKVWVYPLRRKLCQNDSFLTLHIPAVVFGKLLWKNLYFCLFRRPPYRSLGRRLSKWSPQTLVLVSYRWEIFRALFSQCECGNSPQE